MAKKPYSTAKTADEAAAQASAKRGVGKPGFAIGSSKTSPVPGMSRTKAAINSLTEKGRAENVGRVEAVWNSEKFNTGKTRVGPLARGGMAGGGFLDQLK